MTNDTPKQSLNGCDEDEIIAAARSNDAMREELYVDWVTRGKNGQTPDSLEAKALPKAYADFRAREAEACTQTPCRR